MVRKLLKIVGCVLFGLTAGGCEQVNDRNQLAVYLCDSPAEYGGLDCYVDRVEVRSARSGEWIAMEVPGRYFAMMELVNGKMQEAGRVTLPEGERIDAVRIGWAPEGNRVVIAGVPFPLGVGEGEESSTVEFPEVAMEGPNRALLFDLDVAASVVDDPTVESGYRFRPQIEFVDTEACGVVQGGLQVGRSAVTSRLWLRFTDVETGWSGSTYCALDPAGAFFMRLRPGRYRFEVVPGAETGVEDYAAQVEVSRQRVTDLGTIVLEAKGL